jgi:hypothetical protein
MSSKTSTGDPYSFTITTSDTSIGTTYVPQTYLTSAGTYSLASLTPQNSFIIHVNEGSKDHKKLLDLVGNLGIKPLKGDDLQDCICLELKNEHYSLMDILSEASSPVATLSLQVMAGILSKMNDIEKQLKQGNDNENTN